jgi:ring-1,2-phenylacetyl-CoA epoxidase subunit PaaD
MVDAVLDVVSTVPDPEIPVVSIADLGILRGIDVEDGRVHVTITPTYSGCPAMDTIRRDIVDACAKAGWYDVTVRTVLAPAWTTDAMTEEGKQKLREYGIAPPGQRRAGGAVAVTLSVRCPQCGSPDTRELSRFGSTACKALYACNVCLEPFDHFKAI